MSKGNGNECTSTQYIYATITGNVLKQKTSKFNKYMVNIVHIKAT